MEALSSAKKTGSGGGLADVVRRELQPVERDGTDKRFSLSHTNFLLWMGWERAGNALEPTRLRPLTTRLDLLAGRGKA